MNREKAETIALECLAWLAGEDDLMSVFLGASGANEADIRQRAAEPEFLSSVLEFVTMDDQWVVRCCDARGLRYEEPMMAMATLQGAGRTHWT
ncbi:DUF3572 domain-containing protein [Pseudooceanicola sp. LIPI14-2-Ac024]|uniref:DUF3572 domain-containing protein n=1 Tax=Pseudooceanicola sp. LIPI14-2-Ac024 TaxID=3344875 RepID=UPI0035CF2DDD